MKKNTLRGKIALTICALSVPLSAWACQHCGTKFVYLQQLNPGINGVCQAIPACVSTYDTVQCFMNEDKEVWVTCTLGNGDDVQLSFAPCNTDDGCQHL
jgi:hypothetical protein